MPKKMENALRKQAKKMGLLGEKKDSYIYGTIAKAKKKGWVK